MMNKSIAIKNRVLLLNHLERVGFEETYQSLANCHEWRMENVFIPETIERKQFNRLPYFDLPQVFHVRKRPSRLEVAAHESGHAIVMEATHCRTVGRAVIDLEDNAEGLLGFVEPQGYKEASDHPPRVQKSMPCKTVMIINILIDSAGFVGESFVGKKTGSNHERFLVYCRCRCRYLDDRDDVEPLANWNYYVSWCRKILLTNHNLFWRITGDLLANSKLTDPVKTLLHSSIKKEPTQLFF